MRDIIVTIPKNKLAEVEAEELDVAIRQEKGEFDIEYYWEMGRVPKELPRRIYFVWNDAIRAYHEVTRMNSNAVFMSATIYLVNPPISMKAFRGFRYAKNL